MRYQKPTYFDMFRCIADQCPDTCCAGWQIMIDEQALEKYRHIGGAFGQRLRNCVDWDEECFYQYAGRCAFLNENNLCDIVTQLGDGALCETCARYPRHVEEFEDLREWSLSISCPVAAKLVLEGEEVFDLTTWEDDEADPLEDEFEDFDLLLFTKLEDTRDQINKMLKKACPEEVDNCFEQIMKLASDMQDCLEKNEIWRLDDVLACFGDGVKRPLASGNAEEYYQRRKAYFKCLDEMEHLRSSWAREVKEASAYLYKDGVESYKKYRDSFLEVYGTGKSHYAEWQIFKKNLFWFFIYTYFCGAVYDDWIITKAGMAIFAVECVEELVMYHFLADNSDMSGEDWISLSGALAREVEHSDDNLNLLEEWLWQRWESRERAKT